MAIAKWIWGAGFALAFATTAGATRPTFAGATPDSARPVFPAGAEGDWSGTARVKGPAKHLFVHIHKTRAGDYAATVDSPEAETGAVPATPLAAPEGFLAFAADGGEFRGKWNDNRGRWEGTWAEDGLSAPMTLSFNDNSSMSRLRSNDAKSPVIETLPSLPRIGFPAEVVPPSAR
jgi:hypothetical protein